MAVFRIEKTRDYTVMSNHHLRNTDLSLKAKGLLSLMLSLPEEWDYTTKGLARICKDGVDSICAGVRELEDHGYVVRERVRNANGQLGAIEYTILEQPRPPEPKREKPERENPVQANPVLGSPVLGKPEQENPDQLNIDISSNQISKKDLSITQPSNPIQSNPPTPAGARMGTDGMGAREAYREVILGPIPLATMTNRDWSSTGQNYLKSLFALAFQAFLIMVCVGIYSVLVQSIATSGDISGAIWSCMGYTVLLCFALFKTGSLSKSLFGAH